MKANINKVKNLSKTKVKTCGKTEENFSILHLLKNKKRLVFTSSRKPLCGTKHDRDINAAMNILLEGQRMLTAV